MKLVIDSNRLNSDDLRAFLLKSTENIAVLIDFVAIEAYNGNTLNKIYKSMEVVSGFPKQVLILKGSSKVGSMSGKVKGLQRRLIDEEQTRGFPKYIKILERGRNGNRQVQQQLLAYGQSAQAHLDKMLIDAIDIKPIFDTLAKLYSKEERAIIRDKRPYTSEMIGKLGKTVIEISGMAFSKHPFVQRNPTYEELPNTFLFRVALSCYLMAIRRGALSSSNNARPDKIRNDMVDMIFVAYGTYFDGILSNDSDMNHMYEEACLMLSGLFNAEIPNLAWVSKK